MKYLKPVIVVSKCLGFENCTYNGQMKKSDIVANLEKFATYIKICPECSIGLGIPRDTIRIIMCDDELKLYQPKTESDLTDKMNSYCSESLNSLNEVDGFILRGRSPSCGPKDVKIYTSNKKGAYARKGTGFYAKAAKEKFPHIAMEDEGRLTNIRIRDNFLTKIFSSALFNEIKKNKSLDILHDFHSKNKLLYMSYNKKQMKILDNVICKVNTSNIKELFTDYEREYYRIFIRMPRISSKVNVIIYCFERFKDKLNSNEIDFFMHNLQKYQEMKLPLIAVIELLKSYIIRFEDEYLNSQTFFNPYPEQLVSLTNSKNKNDYY